MEGIESSSPSLIVVVEKLDVLCWDLVLLFEVENLGVLCWGLAVLF